MAVFIIARKQTFSYLAILSPFKWLVSCYSKHERITHTQAVGYCDRNAPKMQNVCIKRDVFCDLEKGWMDWDFIVYERAVDI